MLALSAALFYVCFQHVNLKKWAQALQDFHYSFLALAFLSISSILFLKTVQWRIFLNGEQTITFRRLFQNISLWLMMVNLFPFWFGEAFVIYLLGHREGIGKIRMLSVIALDQASEGLSLLGVFGVLGISSVLPEWMMRGMRVVLGLTLSFFIILFALAHRYRDWEEKPRPLVGIWQRFKYLFSKWAHRLSILRSGRKTLAAILLSCSVKGAEALALFLLQRGLDLTVPFWAPFLVIAALNLALMIPLAPGNLGIFEAVVFFVYQYLGVNSEKALSLAILYHLVYSLPLVVTGYVNSMKVGIKIWQRVGGPEAT